MEPPKQLVITWIELACIMGSKTGITNDVQDDVRARASEMLREKVGNAEDVLAYIDQHNLLK